jgi:hypothetical protein
MSIPQSVNRVPPQRSSLQLHEPQRDNTQQNQESGIFRHRISEHSKTMSNKHAQGIRETHGEATAIFNR